MSPTPLQAANAALLRRRQLSQPAEGRGVGAERASTTQLDKRNVETATPSWALTNAAAMVQAYRQRDGIAKEQDKASEPITVSVVDNTSPVSLHEDGELYAKTIKIQPSLYTAVMREGLAKVARILLIAQLVDSDRNGHVPLDALRQFIDANNIMGQRQLRKLLREGVGLFWDRTKTHIDTYAPHVIAVKVGVSHFSGRPVYVPSTAVIGSTKEFKAAIYAAFHAGREWQGRGEVKKPIARETMQGIMGVSSSTQQDYDSIANVRTEKNIAILATNDAQEAAWQTDGGAFPFTDWNGKNGKKGGVYIARQLPNDYHSKLKTASRANTIRTNERLNAKMDNMGINAEASERTGNRAIRQMADESDVCKLYAKDGKQAEKLDKGFWRGTGGVWFEQKQETRTPYPYVGGDTTVSFPVF